MRVLRVQILFVLIPDFKGVICFLMLFNYPLEKQSLLMQTEFKPLPNPVQLRSTRSRWSSMDKQTLQTNL